MKDVAGLLLVAPGGRIVSTNAISSRLKGVFFQWVSEWSRLLKWPLRFPLTPLEKHAETHFATFLEHWPFLTNYALQEKS